MTRQKLRKILLLVSLLFFPVTLYYFSPVLVIKAASEGIIAGSAVVFVGQFLSSLFLGRAFCGWVCPAAGLQMACMGITDKRASRRFDWTKWAIWVPWMGLIAAMVISAGEFAGVNVFYQLESGVSVAEPVGWIVYVVMTLTIAILALSTGRRGFCHFACWMAPFMIIGTGISDRLRLARLRLRSDKDKCIECRRCTRACPMSLDVMEMVQKGRIDSDECVLCGNCIDNCGPNAIRYGFGARAKREV